MFFNRPAGAAALAWPLFDTSATSLNDARFVKALLPFNETHAYLVYERGNYDTLTLRAVPLPA